MKKTEFLNILDDAIENENIKYIEVEAENPESSEFTSFGRNMFKREYDYYKNSYDEDMQLNTYKDEKVVDLRLLNSLDDL